MNTNHKELLSIVVTCVIIALTVLILHRFLGCIAWASVLGITTYPLYKKWEKCFGKYPQTAAFLFTSLLFLLLMIPVSWIITVLITETQIFINYLQNMNLHGQEAPIWLTQLPMIGSNIDSYWHRNLSSPGDITSLLTKIHLSLTHTSYVAKQVGTVFAHTSLKIGFTFLTLFFVYRDGEKLFQQIHKVGNNCLGKRWSKYADQLPKALRATVNGTILVGLGVGLLMGICYKLLGLTAPTLLGFITAFSAMIPFVVPVILFFVALTLIANGALLSALIVCAWGTIVMFVADHFIKPVMIGGAIELPFLAVLFGILGGVELMGILGLFLGPIIMVLFVTLWNESLESL